MTEENTSAVAEGAPVPEPYAPAPDINLPFTEIQDPFATAEPEADIFADNPEDLRRAANEVVERRSVLEKEIVPREYRKVDGSDERSPANEFVSAERAADDLARIRNFEQSQLAELQKDAVRAEHDALRGQAQPEQPAAETPQPPLEAQPEQAEQPGETKLQRALREDPEFRGQVEAMVQAAEAYQQQAAAQLEAERTKLQKDFAARAYQASLETHALWGQLVPELFGAESDAVAADRLNQIRINNPQRYTQIAATLQHVQAGVNNATQAYQQQLSEYNQRNAQVQEAQRAQFNTWADQQDNAFDSYIKSEGRGDLRTVQERMPEILEKNYGISMKELSEAYRSQPWARHAGVQKLLLNATRYELAKEGAARSVSRPVPTVNRPGVSSEPLRDSEGRFSALAKSFNEAPSAKLGAQLLAARRAAGGR